MAEIKPSYDKNRTDLRKALPLKAPISMYIEPTRKCNLKCFYCMHATRDDADSHLVRKGAIEHMDMEIYRMVVKEIMCLPEQPKRITFSGLGEPLMNPNLSEMVRALRKSGYTNRIDVITNGVLLTQKNAVELVDAGITRFIISVQGLTSERNKEICGVPVDVEKFINNIRFLYENKGNADIFVKIIDANLQSEQEKKQFYDMFDGICDTMYVEHLIVMQRETLEFRNADNIDITRNLHGEVIKQRKVCSVMFYFLQIMYDGSVYPCPIPGVSEKLSFGNVTENSLTEIWNSPKRIAMCKMNLTKGYRSVPGCVLDGKIICECVNGVDTPEENIDNHTEEILARLEVTERGRN
jgi:radical SAM protein with 4Fe4S-binding SPASM domain